MKKLLTFLMFFLLASAIVQMQAAEKSVEITQSNSVTATSYGNNTFSVGSIGFGYNQWMKSSSNIQAKASTTNSVYNTTELKYITRIVVKQSGTARAITMYGGTAQKPTTQVTSPSTAAEMTFDFSGKKYTYFSIKTPSNATYFTSITIYYDDVIAPEKPKISFDATTNNVSISAESGCSIYYTTDGETEPTTSSSLYNAPFTLTKSSDVWAIAVKDGISSTVVKEHFTVIPSGAHTLFYESFNTCSGTGGNDNLWSGAIASSTPIFDNNGWTTTYGYGAKECLKIGTGSGKGLSTTPSISFKAGVQYTLLFRAAAWGSTSESKTFELSATDTSLGLITSTVTMLNGAWTDYEYTFTPKSDVDASIKFNALVASNNRFFLDEVRIFYTGDAPVVKTETTTAFAVEAVTKTVGDADFTEAATLTPAEAGSLTYSSSNTDVATVDATGLVHIVGAGTTTIKAEFTGNDDYEASSDSYTLTVNAAALVSIKVDGNPNKSYYKAGEAFVHNGMWVIATFSDGTQDHDFKQGVTWSYDPEILTASTQQVTVTATAAGLSSSKSVTVYVSKKDASVAVETVEVEVGKTATISATTTPADAELTYTVTEGADKISITDGVITGVAEGTATVKATFAGNDEYNTAETTFTVNVIPERHEATIDLSTTNDISGTPTAELIKWEKNGFVITNEKKNEKSTDVTNYYPGTTGKSYTSTRFYNTHTLTITPADGRAITKVEYTATTQDYATTMAGSAWTNATASASETASANGTYTVTITPTDGTEAIVAYLGGTTGGTSFTIYYEDATPVVRTLDHITVSGATTEFKQGDKFEFGGKVMASYEETDVADRDVTSQATFSGYDMNVAGTQTVTVSYTEGEITKTATYDINVEEVFMIKVVVAQPTGGTFVVKNNATGEVVNSGDMLPEETVLKAEATPAEGYAYNYWQVYTDHHTVTKYDGHQNETYKLDKNNIEEEARAVFSASFHKVGKIVYSWSANGNVTTDTYEAGEDVVAPANPANITIDGVEKVFTGWVTTSTVDASTAPEYVTNFGKAQENKMYFAVYATKGEGTGTGDYYEKVPNTYTDWLNGEYLLVYETGTNNKVNVFNAASGTNFVETTVQDNKIYATNTMATIKMVKDLKSDGETPCAWTHVMVKNVADNSYSQYIYNEGSGNTFLYITADAAANLKDTFHQSKYAISISWDTANNRWKATLNGKYIGYSTSQSDFRLNANSNTTNKAVQFYVKKAGVTYSDFTTGDAVKGEFKLVKSTMDLVAGREYIIVSKHAAGNYGLSIDAADSRQNTKYDDNGKELPSTGSKTNNDFRRAEQDVTLFNGDEYASINGKTSVLTLGGAAGAWKFNSAAGYLAMNGDRACLNITTAPADNAELTNIAIDANNKVVIKFNKYPGTETSYRYIFLNFNEGYPRFAAYGAGSTGWTYGKDIYLYYREALNEMTLAEVEANGISGTNYTITDELEVVYSNGTQVWVKDDNKSYARRNMADYGTDVTAYGTSFLTDPDECDQSNWIELNFASAPGYSQGTILKAGTVKGEYTGMKDRSHKMILSAVPAVEEGKTGTYGAAKFNRYCPANFWDDYIYDYVATSGGKFFFMNPKIEEVCVVTAVTWDGEHFVMPARGTDEEGNNINGYNLNGVAAVDWSLNEKGQITGLTNDKAYEFKAVITKVSKANAPARVLTSKPQTLPATYFVISPLNMEASIVTGVNDLNAGKTVKGVRYFNVAGVEFGEAQPGVNIIVTEYTDGSHTSAKVIR